MMGFTSLQEGGGYFFGRNKALAGVFWPLRLSWIRLRWLETIYIYTHILPNDDLMSIFHGRIRKRSPTRQMQGL